MNPTTTYFLVSRADIADHLVSTRPTPQIADNQVLLEVERFGFSANNVTYATLGDEMGYWRFFPTDGGVGLVPVWGHATVVESRAGGVEPGQRFFGYLPLSTHLVVEPTRVSPAGFTDGAAHRSDLPAVYQRYARAADAESVDQAAEDQDVLWRPLFMTSFGAADFLAENNSYDAQAVVITSASSKTAMGIAFSLRVLGVDLEIIGLTSPGNAEFTASLGYYDEVLTYDQLDPLGERSIIVVDLTGNEVVLSGIAQHAGTKLLRTVIVGGTHWQDRERSLTATAPGTELFFLPTWIEKRREDWGPTAFVEKSNEAWAEFAPTTDSWMTIEEHRGVDGIAEVYDAVLAGSARPDLGYILQFAE